MANNNEQALIIAREYFDAMEKKDVEKITALSSDDIVCESPVGSLKGIQAFRGFQEGFARMIIKLTLVAAFGDDKHAVIVYVSDTHPVKDAYVTEYITVENGKMVSTRVIYDGQPFAAYLSTQQKH